MSFKRNVVVDHDVCVGSTMCTQIAGNVFTLNKNMQSEVINISGDSMDKIAEAVDNCPVRAISMEESVE